MTDLNKEREAFELFELNKRPCATPASLFERFDSNDLGEDEQHYVGRYVDSYMQEKWELWQKAKAQAVPDGIINKIQSWVAVKSFAAEDAHPDLPIIDANELAEFIDQLVASESGVEG
ncbi:TPA: hypothetical protein JIG72_000891 [Acinetobacter baumannii]|uniref:hypothetical protein n=1 Tax=Acinetobacter baumannii TaxID=470 RepID=UPI000DE64458|nr:hypothetical protein [Acinetobacter baumannii]CAH1069521.1 Uncharacterised protein [Acinetobacter phage MD-2021a]SSR47245.1 Uncharacterised protein [Acinetobacter baumannii]SSR60315.1 Uncharacterised protein [Acinetobacter baumannii]SSR61401.1 Uncharacterised protein [Acinetobacter baumannii]SSR73719.1 Uncharacterised protein [Acinetobacter baumannii]